MHHLPNPQQTIPEVIYPSWRCLYMLKRPDELDVTHYYSDELMVFNNGQINPSIFLRTCSFIKKDTHKCIECQKK
jgi:hypothetical protein